MMEEGWIGFDLDGTLAEYHGWSGINHIGEPIPAMVTKLKELTMKGWRCKIFTARANEGRDAIFAIEKWLEKHDLPPVEITSKKDFAMVVLYDDRCISVELNTGIVLGGKELD